MRTNNDEVALSRRGFIRKGVVYAAAGMSLSRVVNSNAQAQDANAYGPFKMGIQTYSLRNFDRKGMLERVKQLKVKYIEAVGSHFSPTDDKAERARCREALEAAGIELKAMWCDFSNDPEANRRVLEFAADMGIPTLTGAPSKESIAALDKVLDDFEVNIAIHNHGPGSEYSKIQDVLDAIEGHHERIGSCNDTAWFIASGEDPVEAIRVFGKRLYAMHLKDITADKQMTEIGKGALDVVGTLEALAEVGFDGVLALEYEEHPEDPAPYMEECLLAVRAAMKKVKRQP